MNLHLTNREPNNRKNDQPRSIEIEVQVNRYAEGSVLIRAGHTHVLCMATIEESVPSWMKGKGKGWITAEYSMLPRSTHTRSKRDREKTSGRTHEIQRLIGRALRSCVDLSQIGERSILIDCDVLQADGGTRTASITGGCIALAIALSKLVHTQKIPSTAWLGGVSAISIGIKNQQPLVDLDYSEDSTCDVDMNFVMTKFGEFVELQGTGEQKTFNYAQLQQMSELAIETLKKIHLLQKTSFQSTEWNKAFDF